MQLPHCPIDHTFLLPLQSFKTENKILDTGRKRICNNVVCMTDHRSRTDSDIQRESDVLSFCNSRISPWPSYDQQLTRSSMAAAAALSFSAGPTTARLCLSKAAVDQQRIAGGARPWPARSTLAAYELAMWAPG